MSTKKLTEADVQFDAFYGSEGAIKDSPKRFYAIAAVCGLTFSAVDADSRHGSVEEFESSPEYKSLCVGLLKTIQDDVDSGKLAIPDYRNLAESDVEFRVLQCGSHAPECCDERRYGVRGNIRGTDLTTNRVSTDPSSRWKTAKEFKESPVYSRLKESVMNALQVIHADAVYRHGDLASAT